MELWDNLLEKFRGPIEFQTQKRGEQIQAEIDYYNTPEGQRAAQIGGGIMAAMLPIPGSRLLGINRVTTPLINKTYGAVGRDMVGRAPLPVSKTPVQTARGPRGPINVEQPRQLPLPLKGGRNTGGLSETDKAMLDFIKPKGIMNTPSAKSHMEKIGAAKRTEQLANRRKFLEDALRLDQSRIKAGEAPSKDYSKLLEEYTRLIESLK
jgi:hypothetical protein